MYRFNTKNILSLLMLIAILMLSTIRDGYAVSGQNKSTKQSRLQTAYTIVLPGADMGNNMFTKAKVYEIPKVSKDYYVPNSVIVKTKNRQIISPAGKQFGSSVLNSSIDDLGIENVRAPYEKYGDADYDSPDYTGISRIYEIRYAAPVDPYDVCRELMKNPEIEYAVPQFYSYTTEFTPNDSRFGNQYALARIEAEKAWDISTGDSEVLIAIIDTGIDWTHEDLIDNIWINPGEVEGDGIDNDGNGKIDDVRGWDFIGNVSRQQFFSGQSNPDNDTKPVHSSNTHGTHVSGCAAATTDNGKGVASPGFNSKILPIKCSADNTSAVQGKLMRTYEAIMYAAELGAKVINCSWGGPGFSPYNQDVINQVTAMGTLIVAASGNDNSLIDDGSFYPAGYDNVLCVGATRSNDRIAWFSNYGHKVTVYGPGDRILATNPGNNYGNKSGTSMASPIVAGIAGLVLDVHKDWTPAQVIHQIRSTSDNVVASGPSIRPIQYGRVNAYKALSYNSAAFPANKVPGVGISEQYFFDGDIINDFERYAVRYTLTNYLAGVTGLSVKVTPLDYFVSVDRENVNIGSLLAGSTKNFTLNVQLSEETPWYSGTAKLLFTYEADGYTDYELVSIPFKLSSPNMFKHVIEVSDGSVVWQGVSSPSKNAFWAVGRSSNGRGVFYRNGSQGAANLDNSPATAVYAFDASRAIAAISPEGGDAIIATTTNGGQNWDKQNVGAIADFINGIHFFDDQNGLFLADPKNNTWRVGRTTNVGADWSLIANLPKPLYEEASIVEASYQLNDNVWFGTNKGRLIYTNDRGVSWKSSTVFDGGIVRYVSFVNNDSGMVVYSESPDSNGPWIASITLDGGETWMQRHNFTEENNLQPVSIYSPQNSAKMIVTMLSGEIIATNDLGRYWDPILSYKYSNVTNAAASSSVQDVRLWMAGADISYVDFTYEPDNASRVLNITTGNTYDFDTVNIGTNTTGKVGLENLGNVRLNISDISFSYTNSTSEEFYLFLSQPSEIQPGESKNITVRFSPGAVGRRDAVLIVNSNAEGSPHSVNLTGFSRDPSTVESDEIESIISLNVLPNPVAGEAEISYILTKDERVLIDIVDMRGGQVINLFRGMALAGENLRNMNTANLVPGVYFVNLTIGKRFIRKKFVVVD